MAKLFGWVFLVVGILGFIPNPIIGGTESLFQTDLNHNIVHLLSGVVLLWVAYKSQAKAGTALVVFGVIYLLVALLGFMSSSESVLGLIHVNGADNWLHLVLGLVILVSGLKARKGQGMAQSMPQM
ncbi:MAG: hypothetical protein AB200_02085 [Parcubacteria bacterium C7867-005]|nr:MAG: hypothetical protein AB200_02085 [Parcubacteria bacterium C7867-005]